MWRHFQPYPPSGDISISIFKNFPLSHQNFTLKPFSFSWELGESPRFAKNFVDVVTLRALPELLARVFERIGEVSSEKKRAVSSELVFFRTYRSGLKKWPKVRVLYYGFPIKHSFLLSKIRNLVKNKSLDSAPISDLCMEYEIKQTFVLGNFRSF